MRLKNRYRCFHYGVGVSCLLVNAAFVFSVLEYRGAVKVGLPTVVTNVVHKVVERVEVEAEKVGATILKAPDFYVSGTVAQVFGVIVRAGDRTRWGIVRAVHPWKVVCERDGELIEIVQGEKNEVAKRDA